ncbi:hypothetical protein CJ030_MR1G029397 [Morella rubra]|uniref:30S ribosomal protein S6 n=1 Tax=Morella rubra TaxID=262757 RepID=A0A6A1UIP2_9ROSI|nr:hypothetical protein CJ030_MR0G029412 [Morella rubra]KAB1227233.1 hypothetical protein CJ030_MR1G029397 [Morella rubra]
MPLYDCMLLLKPHVTKEALMDLVARIGKHVYRRNGVLTDMKCFGAVQLGYGIKKLDGRYYQRFGDVVSMPEIAKTAPLSLGFCRNLFLLQSSVSSYSKYLLPFGIGQLMQMTMMATPNMNNELHYLNKEDRLLRWLLIKHRDTKYGLEFLTEDDGKGELSKFTRSSIYDEDEDDDDDDEEYEVDQEVKKEN